MYVACGRLWTSIRLFLNSVLRDWLRAGNGRNQVKYDSIPCDSIYCADWVWSRIPFCTVAPLRSSIARSPRLATRFAHVLDHDPRPRLALKVLGVDNGKELSAVFGAVGLVQNFAVLRALVTEGLQRGHMSLHAKNIAMMAGATGAMVDKMAQKMVADNTVRMDVARKLLEEM